MKKYCFIVIFILLDIIFIQKIYAQQLPQFSLYQLDDLVFNPAVLGTKENDQITLHHRSQWLGFEGAPITQVLSYNGKLQGNMGLGGYLMHDITGASRRLSFNIGYAYNFAISSKTMVSLGLLGTLMQYGIDGDKVTIHEMNDPSLYQGYSDRAWKPDVSIGSYVKGKDFFVSLSVMQLFTSRVRLFKNEDFTAIVPLVQHFYVASGYDINVDDNVSVEPIISMHSTLSSPLQFDITMRGNYNNMFFGSLTYRYNDAILLSFGALIKDKVKVAYAYDLLISDLRTTNSGSHEIVITILLSKKSKRSSFFRR